jgi:hypothetical protein
VGLVGIVVEFLRTVVDGVPVTDVKIDEGGEDNSTGELYQPAGFDSNPLPDDFVVAMRVPGSDRFAVIGYLDPVNEPTTEPGQTRAYSRDADGNILCTIKLTDFVNLGIDEPENFIPRDDRLQTQLAEIEANIADLQSAHDNHVHTNPEGGNVGPAVPTTTETYTVGDTACDKVKGE